MMNYYFHDKLEECKETLKSLNSKYPEIEMAKQSILEYDLTGFENNIFNDLQNKLIKEWVKYQSKSNVEKYDMIYFEYHEQSHEYSEALSYGVYDMVPNDFGNEYKTSWDAGLGIDLEPFKLTKPLGYQSIDDDDYYDLITIEDDQSGYNQIWNTVYAMCDYSLNKSFMRADQLNLFDNLRIKSEGLFAYDMHDNGTDFTPFYIKE